MIKIRHQQDVAWASTTARTLYRGVGVVRLNDNTMRYIFNTPDQALDFYGRWLAYKFNGKG